MHRDVWNRSGELCHKSAHSSPLTIKKSRGHLLRYGHQSFISLKGSQGNSTTKGRVIYSFRTLKMLIFLFTPTKNTLKTHWNIFFFFTYYCFYFYCIICNEAGRTGARARARRSSWVHGQGGGRGSQAAPAAPGTMETCHHGDTQDEKLGQLWSASISVATGHRNCWRGLVSPGLHSCSSQYKWWRVRVPRFIECICLIRQQHHIYLHAWEKCIDCLQCARLSITWSFSLYHEFWRISSYAHQQSAGDRSLTRVAEQAHLNTLVLAQRINGDVYTR